jgi:hypothetical protein
MLPDVGMRFCLSVVEDENITFRLALSTIPVIQTCVLFRYSLDEKVGTDSYAQCRFFNFFLGGLILRPFLGQKI